MAVLSKHAELTFKDLDRNFQLDWDWKLVSENPALPLLDLLVRIKQEGSNTRFIMANVSRRIDITEEMVLRFWDIPWEPSEFRLDNFSLPFIAEHADMKWDWGVMFHNGCVLNSHVLKLFLDAPFPWDLFLEWRLLPARFFIETGVPLNLRKLSGSMSISIPILEARIDDPGWDWEALAANDRIPSTCRARHPEKPWTIKLKKKGAKDDQPITIARANCDTSAWTQAMIISAIEDRTINYHECSRSRYITEKFATKYIDLPWDWRVFQYKGKVSPMFIFAHPELPWDRAHYTYPLAPPTPATGPARQRRTVRCKAEEELVKKHKEAALKIENWWYAVAVYDTRFKVAARKFRERMEREAAEIEAEMQ